MAKLNKTEDAAVGFCLDESGSMGSCFAATIEGFNTWLKEIRKQKGETTVTLTQFSSTPGEDKFRVHYATTIAADVKKLTTRSYRPRGGTPLFDAIGATITTLQKELDKRKKNPPAAVVVIQTDGQENSSTDYTRDQIRKLIEKKEKEGWTFIFLGANMTQEQADRSAFDVGLVSAVAYAGATTSDAFSSTSDVLRSVKASRLATGQTRNSKDATDEARVAYRSRMEKPTAKKK